MEKTISLNQEQESSTKRKAWYQIKIDELEQKLANRADIPAETGVFRAPAVAWMLIWNEYARLTHNFSFLNSRETQRKDKTGTSWKVSNDRTNILVTKQVDRARFELAQQEASTIEIGLADLMARHRACYKELHRRKQAKADPEHIRRAQEQFDDIDAELRYARDRHDECRKIVEAAQPVMYRIPLAALHELEVNDIPLTVSEIQANGRFLRKLDIPNLKEVYESEE